MKAEGLTEAQKRYPVGRMLTDPVRGTFLSFPLVGWVSRRQLEGTPVVVLILALVGEKESFAGLLQVELPAYPETTKATASALQRYGWTGDTWSPGDPGWPTGDADSEAQILSVLQETKLKATFVFPPVGEGTPAQSVEVARASGNFLMPPLEEGDAEDSLVEKLREMVSNPTRFFKDPHESAILRH